MDFFNSAIDVLQTLVIALGGGLCVWGGINLLEGYGQDNPAAKSQGVKQLVAGGGVALIGVTLIPLLSGPERLEMMPSISSSLNHSWIISIITGGHTSFRGLPP